MIRWLFSKTIRDAGALHKQVYRMLCAQKDLMNHAAFMLVSDALVDLRKALHNGESVGKIREKMWTCEEVANKWLKPYPHPIWRENVEVLLVAIAVAMAIRTFFLQPFKIPTGSMQPTLYGITVEPDYGPLWYAAQASPSMEKTVYQQIYDSQTKMVTPTGWNLVKDWFRGISYVHYVAQADGQVVVGPMLKMFIFNIKQTISVGGVEHTFWFPPDYGESPKKSDGTTIDPFTFRAGFVQGRYFHKGDTVVNLKVIAGDHLFVDRVTYNFRKPARGDIVVFMTKGIPEDQRDLYDIPPDEFYIKRLCGLGGETLQLQQDYTLTGAPNAYSIFGAADGPIGHLLVNGQALSAATPHFENLYSYDNPTAGTKTIAYHGDGYYGHAMLQRLAPGQQVQVRPGHLFVMGDDTLNSLDSRYWGDFPEDDVIGKSFFVYWPLSSRFGWGNQ